MFSWWSSPPRRPSPFSGTGSASARAIARRASADWYVDAYELAAAATLGARAAMAGGVLAWGRAPWLALACSRGALTGQRACQLRCPAADLTSSTRRAGVGLLGLNTTISALMIRLATRSRTCPLAATIG